MPKQTKVIVVEDDNAMREISVRKLSSAGFTVHDAQDGKEGLAVIEREKPDLVMLDLMMPEMDGFAVLEALRKNPDPQIANVPIIVLSNIWSSNDILRVKSYNVDEYLVKAYFTPDEILGKIKEVLARRQAKIQP